MNETVIYQIALAITVPLLIAAVIGWLRARHQNKLLEERRLFTNRCLTALADWASALKSEVRKRLPDEFPERKSPMEELTFDNFMCYMEELKRVIMKQCPPDAKKRGAIPTPSRFWELTPIPQDPNYVPDAQEIAEMQAIEDGHVNCKHPDFNEEDGCPDCGYYAK